MDVILKKAMKEEPINPKDNMVISAATTIPKRIPKKFVYYHNNMNGRSKASIGQARLRLRYFKAFYVSKKTAFEDSRLQKIRRQLLFGSFRIIFKHFRVVDLSNEYIQEVLPLMRRITVLHEMTLHANSKRSNKKVDNFGFQGKILKKYFRIRHLKRYCCEGNIMINKGEEFMRMTRMLTRATNLVSLNLDIPPENLISLAEHQKILKDAPHRFRRLRYFIRHIIPNLMDPRINENVIRFYAKFFARSCIRVLKVAFNRNNYNCQIIFLHFVCKSARLESLHLDLDLNSGFSEKVLNQVATSLRDLHALKSLSINLKIAYGSSFVTLLRGLTVQTQLKVLELTLDKIEYSKEETQQVVISLEKLTGLEELNLRFSIGFWNNLENEFTVAGFYNKLVRKNLKVFNLKFDCEATGNSPSLTYKKSVYEHICKYLPQLLAGLQGSLTGLHLVLYLEYFEEFKIPMDVLKKIFQAISKMVKLKRLVVKVIGFPFSDDYPNMLGTVKNLTLLNELYLSLDFLTEDDLLGILNRLTHFSHLNKLYFGSGYLHLEEKAAKSIFRFLRIQKGLIRKRFALKCKNSKLAKAIDHIR